MSKATPFLFKFLRVVFSFFLLIFLSIGFEILNEKHAEMLSSCTMLSYNLT